MTLDEINNLFIRCNFVHNRETTAEWGFDYSWIPHNNLVLIYEGEGVFESRGQRHTVKKGDLVLFRRGENQKMITDRDNLLKLYTVNFFCTRLEQGEYKWTAHDIYIPMPFVTHIQNDEIFEKMLHLFKRLHRIHLSSLPIHESEERAVIAQILELSSYHNHPNHSINYRSKSKINKTISFMAEHFCEQLTLTDLAKYSGLSKPHFSAMFKKVTDTSPINYLIKLRISHAKRLLEDGKSVTQAAEESGFADIYYFSNVFKRLEGHSPTQYIHALRSSAFTD